MIVVGDALTKINLCWSALTATVSAAANGAYYCPATAWTTTTTMMMMMMRNDVIAAAYGADASNDAKNERTEPRIEVAIRNEVAVVRRWRCC